MKIHNLYPIKFKPICKKKVWGNQRLVKLLNKDCSRFEPIGETWEISAVQGDISIVENGFLKGNNLQELVEIYLTDLVGDKVYYKYGIEFPLLIKFIDANELLSVQVHPDDQTARFRHNAYGKTEMWYVVHAEPGAKLYMGWNQDMDRQTLLKALEDGSIVNYLNEEQVKPGDVFFIPPGRVHALGPGIVVAEIQETSDITYRLYDWGRVGLDGKPRELNIDLALDVIDYKAHEQYKTTYSHQLNQTTELISCEYFTTNLLEFNKIIEKNYMTLDSFVIYIVISGSFALEYYKKQRIELNKGDVVLLPAEFEQVRLLPFEKSKILEVYIENIQLDYKSTLETFFGEGEIA